MMYQEQIKSADIAGEEERDISKYQILHGIPL
jgi:hypothetical protein